MLILSMMAIGASNVFAWVPTDLNNPKCVDLKDFGKEGQKIVKGKNFCGCKNCEFTAITYDKLDDYLYGVLFDLDDNDAAIIKFIQTSINANSVTNGAEAVIFFADSFRETLCSKFPKAGKTLIGAVTVAGIVVGLISSIVDNYYSGKVLIEKNKINNVKRVLKYMSSDIVAKNYKYGNYYFISTNYGIGEADAIGTFAKKENIKYDVKYGEAYFNKIKKHADSLLEAMEDSSFFKYSSHQYDTKMNDLIKKLRKASIGTDLALKGITLASKNNWNMEKIKAWLKSEGEVENLTEKATTIEELMNSDYSNLLNDTEKVLIYMEDKLPKSANIA